MDEIVSNVLLVGDKSMPEMHLKQPGFISWFYQKQRKNWKMYANRKYRLYLQKWSV